VQGAAGIKKEKNFQKNQVSLFPLPVIMEKIRALL
jgi:hypothetical protein